MSIKELFFVYTCIIVGLIMIITTQPVVFNTDIPLLGIALALLFFSQSVEIPIGGLVFNIKSFSMLYLLLFIRPESILILSIITLLVYIKDLRRFLFKVSFEILQIGFGNLLFKIAPNDYLKILLFAIGYMLGNVFLTIFYVKFFGKTSIKNYIRALFLISVLSLFGSMILTTIYTFNEVKLSSLIFVSVLYSGFLIQLYYTVFSELWHKELTLEKEQIAREIENLMKLPEILEKSSKEDIDDVLQDVLATTCKLIGFEYALLSIFDFRSGKVTRISKYGIKDEDFEKLKQNRPDIKSTYVLMQQRFDVGGAYFIPNGSVDLSQSSIYRPSEYFKLEVENAWDPNDLFIVPLIYNKKTIGYISFDKPANMLRPSKREIELAKFFAWQITRLLSESKYSVFFLSDYKKEQTYAFLMEEISKNIEFGKSFLIVYVDIDKFEKVNITHGFKAGDEMLQELRNISEEEIKNLGIFSQFNDELIMLLWSMSKSDGVLVAERIIEKFKRKYPDVSLSVSVVKYPTDAQTFDELLEKIKVALTTAKKSGGGRIVTL